MQNLVVKILFVFLLFLSWPAGFASAHGGVEKSIGTVTVFLNQSPISPFVGEPVTMNFVLGDKNSFDRFKNLDVQLTLIDTFYGDATKDTTILTQSLKTDANGSFDFSYTFNKENYFDVELTFKDPKTGQQDSTGFLVQPREPGKLRFNYAQLILGAVVGIVLVLGIKNFWKRK